MAEESKGKSTVSFTEWNAFFCKIVCHVCSIGKVVVKYETVTVDGVQGQPEKKRQVRVPGPDLTGADIQMIASLCVRFGFKIADLADECRDSDRQRNARELRAQLIQQDKKAGVV